MTEKNNNCKEIIERYNVEDKGNWKQVVFSSNAKIEIIKYLQEYPNSSSTVIRDNLFPNIHEDLKNKAAYEIQIILGRA
jgi:hypothetical protein